MLIPCFGKGNSSNSTVGKHFAIIVQEAAKICFGTSVGG